ncbi:MAG: chitinase [Actinobacteria bacterium]|nr:chitinase [Actinomycetota bacterium]
MIRRRLRYLAPGVALVAAATLGAQAAAQATTARTATAQTANAQAQAPATSAISKPWPRQVYAPYYESWLSGSIATSAQQSGSPYETVAFIQTASAGSCALTWNGDATEPIPGTTFASDIASLQRRGGNVIPSFGGYGADSTGTEIADSCTDVNAIAADYEAVITTYHVTRLDMDVEASSLTNTAGIARRNQALKLVEQWAARRHQRLQVQYTLPVEPTGLTASDLAVLQNAAATGTRVDVVNIMTFDYYLASEPSPLPMGADAISAATNTHAQLATVYPHASSAQRWALEGITMMPGIDDYPGGTEVTHLSDAQQVLTFARSHGLALLSIWAIQRDNGGCPGTVGASTCSGIAQNSWDFSHLLEHFNR